MQTGGILGSASSFAKLGVEMSELHPGQYVSLNVTEDGYQKNLRFSATVFEDELNIYSNVRDSQYWSTAASGEDLVWKQEGKT